MVRTVAELLGCALVLAFLYFVWPPLVLGVAGVMLVAYANTGDVSTVDAPPEP